MASSPVISGAFFRPLFPQNMSILFRDAGMSSGTFPAYPGETSLDLG